MSSWTQQRADPVLQTYLDTPFMDISRTWIASDGRTCCGIALHFCKQKRTKLEGTILTFRLLGLCFATALLLLGVLFVSMPISAGTTMPIAIAALVIGSHSFLSFFLESFLCTGPMVFPLGSMRAIAAELTMQAINFCLSAAFTAWVVADYYRYDVLAMVFAIPFGLNTLTSAGVVILDVYIMVHDKTVMEQREKKRALYTAPHYDGQYERSP